MPRSIDDEIAELFGDDPEPVIELTIKKAPPKAPPAEEPPPAAEPDVTEPGSLRAAGPILGLRPTPATSPEQPASEPEQPASEPEQPASEPPPPARELDRSAQVALCRAAIEAIRGASGRDEITTTVLSFLGRVLDRAAIFKAAGQELSGWVSTGLAPTEALDQLRLSLDTPSTLAKVARDGRSHIGALDTIPGDGALSSLLSPPPSVVVLAPVHVAGRIACILYGDLGRRGGDIAPVAELVERVALEMGEAFEGLIRRRKKG